MADGNLHQSCCCDERSEEITFAKYCCSLFPALRSPLSALRSLLFAYYSFGMKIALTNKLFFLLNFFSFYLTKLKEFYIFTPQVFRTSDVGVNFPRSICKE
jgi:hypothetical protein